MSDTWIRPAGPADAEAIAEAHAESWASTYRGQLPPHLVETDDFNGSAKSWLARLIQVDTLRVTLVAEERQRGVVGFALAGPARRPRRDGSDFDGEIYALYLKKAAQRQGIGARLTAAQARVMLARGFTSAEVWALSTNGGAARFYRAMGAVPIGERRIRIGGVNLKESGFGWTSLTALARHEFPRQR